MPAVTLIAVVLVGAMLALTELPQSAEPPGRKIHAPATQIRIVRTIGNTIGRVPPWTGASGVIIHLRAHSNSGVSGLSATSLPISPNGLAVQGVDDGSRVEQRSGQHGPDDPDVAEPRIQCRQDHRHGHRDHQEPDHQHRRQQPCPERSDAEREDEHERDDQVQPQVEEARDHDGQRDHEARELRLADDRLLAHDRADGRRARLLEEAEQDDVHQQQHRIVRHPGAEMHDVREYGEQHGEQQQRAADRPDVPEHRVCVRPPELHHGHQVQQLQRAAPAAAER